MHPSVVQKPPEGAAPRVEGGEVVREAGDEVHVGEAGCVPAGGGGVKERGAAVGGAVGGVEVRVEEEEAEAGGVAVLHGVGEQGDGDAVGRHLAGAPESELHVGCAAVCLEKETD